MVRKIKKKTKKGPKAPHSIPLAIAMTALYGPQCEGRDFRHTFEDPPRLRAALRLQLDQDIIPSDRVISFREYLDWQLNASPGRLAGMFASFGFIPMGPPVDEEEAGKMPRLGILPMLAIVKAKDFQTFSDQIHQEWGEVPQVAFHNSISSTFSLIPGYDRLILQPPCPARDLNRAIRSLNQNMEEAFHTTGYPYPGPFEPFPDEVLVRIPIQEAIPK